MATDPSSLSDHLPALYPVARVLVGPDHAESLLQHVYERAAAVPPEARPEPVKGWLFRLLLEMRDESPSPDSDAPSSDDASSFVDDPFRREAAEQIAEQMLPVAFASCSVRERAILAIDVLVPSSEDLLAEALQGSPAEARQARDQARSVLRAALRDVLSGPERMLVDASLPDSALRDQLQALLADRLPPVPASLRSSVLEVIERARSDRLPDPERASREEQPSDDSWGLGLSVLDDRFSLRGLLSGLAFVFIVTAGIGGASYLFSSSPSPSPSSPTTVLDLTIQEASGVERTLETTDAQDALAHIRQSWNRRLSVPRIEAASLQGVGRLSLPAGLSVPVLLYADDASGTPIRAVAFNYALLDQLGDRATLDRTLRTKLAANTSPLTAEQADRPVVLWRQRDDIFVVVTPSGDAETLRSRLRF